MKKANYYLELALLSLFPAAVIALILMMIL